MSLSNNLIKLILKYNNFVLYYLIFINISYTFLLLLALKGIKKYRYKLQNWPYHKMILSIFVPPLSILVPCYNEEKTIVDNIKSLLSIEYNKFEIVVINDGSNDKTLDMLIKAFDLHKLDSPYRRTIPTKEVRGVYLASKIPNLTVVDKVNGGKADALNVGINICKYPLFTSIDADSILEKRSLLKVVRPFIDEPDRVVATGGIVRVVNGSKVNKGFIEEVALSKKPLAILQTVEYLRAFLFGRMGWSEINSLLIVSGAFGVFKKDIVLELGGYSADTIGEDMELIIKIHKYMKNKKTDYSIIFVPDPVCWTQVPEDLKSLKKQRIRWHRGLMDSLINHRDMFLNPKYGIIGTFAVPYFWIVEMISPIIEILGYISVIASYFLGILNYEFAIIFFIFAVLYGVFLSLGSVILEEYNFMKYENVSDYLKLVLYGVIENFGYRQLVTLWRFRAFIGYKRKENKWGKIERKGFDN